MPSRSQVKRRAYYRFPPMAERVQLKEPGSELTMTVAKVSAEQVGTDDYYLFTGGGKELLVPQSSVGRQLDRLGVADVPETVGMTIKFSRSTGLNKFKKPYWNLDLASGNGAIPPTTTPAVRAPANTDGPPPSAEEKPKLAGIYLEATEFVLDRIIPLYEKAEIGVSDTAAAAMVHTLFIAKSKEL